MFAELTLTGIWSEFSIMSFGDTSYYWEDAIPAMDESCQMRQSVVRHGDD
jgi:hypothetical protein